ncbi:MAG: hypothetical protein AAGF23_13860 [Acidobacteriota bacterium]
MPSPYSHRFGLAVVCACLTSAAPVAAQPAEIRPGAEGPAETPTPAVARSGAPADAPAGDVERGDASLGDVLALGPREILQITPEMEAFLAERIGPGQIRATRLRNLTDAIFSEDGLGVTYGNKRTKTAEETSTK